MMNFAYAQIAMTILVKFHENRAGNWSSKEKETGVCRCSKSIRSSFVVVEAAAVVLWGTTQTHLHHTHTQYL